ncbi:S53 family peptidase [Streptomyces sp. NBC_01465]|uniref:S53 family peptidase n=1 Tax=Streptomyces sp. NBC_01465 TaxID=2903878 RepID=UPI002E3158F5|nr:S53 family peptidase [Streptomyces sp. NBC_01465]
MVCTALLGAALAGPSARADAPTVHRHVLAGSRPGYATASADEGPVPSEQRLTARLHLGSRDPAGLASFLKSVTDPRSPGYRRFLTPDQYRGHFALGPQEHLAIATWLTGAGLTVTRDTPHYIEVSGPAKSMQEAVGSSFHRYKTAQGDIVSAPTDDISVPAAIGADVVAVSGLSVPSAAHPLSTRATAPESTSTACSTHFGQKPAAGLPSAYGRPTTYSPCPYVPAQLRRAYGAGGPGASGKGTTVAIVDAYGSSTMPADADRFARSTGDLPFRPGQYRQQVTPENWTGETACAPPETWAGEQALDVDMAHGLAPDANVLYVGANSCLDDDLMDAEASVIDHRLADSISNSWAEIIHSDPGHLTPDLVSAWNLLFEQAAAEGIGVYFAAGDCGDSSPGAAETGVNCDAKTTTAQADFPSGSPWVTSVGGTTLALDRRGEYAWETSMGDELSILTGEGDQQAWGPVPGVFAFGGGGGLSDFPEPWYQHGRVPSPAVGAHARRSTPDVAMEGDGALPVLVGLTDAGQFQLVGFGGTSAATPAFAAVQADAQQEAGRPLGFANPLLYFLGSSPAFRDVTDQPPAAGHGPLAVVRDYGPSDGDQQRYILYTLGRDYGLHAGPGYDYATGLGSPSPAYLQRFRRTGRHAQ